MSFNNSSRKVVNPSIINSRLKNRSSGNVWYYVTQINLSLEKNDINIEENSIDVTFNFELDLNILESIIEIYEAEGWDVVFIINEDITKITFKVFS